MPLVRVDGGVYAKLKILRTVLGRLGIAKSMSDVINYLLKYSQVDDILTAAPKELALIYAQLARKSWNELNAELTSVCGSGVEEMSKEADECIRKYLEKKLGLDEINPSPSPQ